MPRQAQELKAAAVGKLTAPSLHFVGGMRSPFSITKIFVPILAARLRRS
jgi:hypothetical protein